MTEFNYPLLAAADAAVPEGGGLGAILMMLSPLLILVVMWFLMIRPQRKQEKKLKEQRENMKVGDRIVTIGGVTGRVVNIKDDEVTITSSVANTMMTFRKDAINQVIQPISDDT